MSLSPLSLLMVSLILLLAIFGIWLGAPIEGLWRLPAGLLITFIALERLRLTTNYTIQRSIPLILGLGEAVRYSVTISNNNRSKLKIDTQADYPEHIDGDNTVEKWRLQGDESTSRQFSVTPIELGGSSLGKLYLKQLGSFGLCWWTRSLDDQTSFMVEPLRLGKSINLPGHQQVGNRSNRFQQNTGFELLELRDYQPGDSLRSIDWKATARRGKQVIRRFEREHRLEIVVLIDCSISSRVQYQGLDRLHHYINVGAKLTEFAAMQGDKIACIAYAQKAVGRVAMTGGINATRKIRQLLAGLSASNETANPLNAALEVKQLLKHRGLVIYLTELEQPEAASQLIQAGQLLGAKHQVLIATLDDPTIANVIAKKAQQWLDPYRHFAAIEYQRGREMTRMQLQRKGIAITTGSGKSLDQQVLSYYQNKRETISSA